MNYSALVLPLIPLLALLFSTFGVAFGLLAETVEVAQLGTYVLLFVLVLAAPVFIPWEALPEPLRWVSLLMPFTYAADALHMTLANTIGTQFWLDIGVLLALLVGSLFFWSVVCAGVWNSLQRAYTAILRHCRKAIQPIQQNNSRSRK